jgi:nicotinamidase-related amidase
MSRAILIIDVQESFRQRPIWAAISAPDIVERINTVIAHARSVGDRVIWVLHAEPGSGGVFDPVSGHVRLIDGLDRNENEPILTKTSHNCFTTTNLQQRLTAERISEIVITGIRTEQCCETTARVGCDLGFDVTFLIDATATFPSPDHRSDPSRALSEVLADPTTLSCEAMMQRTEYALAGRFAAVQTIAEWWQRLSTVEAT